MEIWHLVGEVVVTLIVEGVVHLIFYALRGFVSPNLGRLWRRPAHQNNPQIPRVMNLFPNAKVVRLRGNHNKYLYAGEDEISVTQDESGSSKNVCWTVEFCSESEDKIRLKSCYGKYLTASNKRFLLGLTGCLDSSVEWQPIQEGNRVKLRTRSRNFLSKIGLKSYYGKYLTASNKRFPLSVTGRKVLQTASCLDSSVEWQLIEKGNQVKLRTPNGKYLRANDNVWPWRNSVTHDVPYRTAKQDWILWDVDVVEIVSDQSPQPTPGVRFESSESGSSSESESSA